MLLLILRIHQIFPAAIAHPNNLLTHHVKSMLGGTMVLFGIQYRRDADFDTAMRPAFVYVGGNTKSEYQRPLSQSRCHAIYAPRNQHPHGFCHLDSADQDDSECSTTVEAEKDFVCPLCPKFNVSSLLPSRSKPLLLRGGRLIRAFLMVSGVISAILRLFSIRKFVASQDFSCKLLLLR